MGGKGKRKASGARGTPQGAQRGGKKGQKGTAPFESTVVVKAKPSGRALPIPVSVPILDAYWCLLSYAIIVGTI